MSTKNSTKDIVVGWLLALFLVPVAMLAQSGSGAISGTIVDNSGAAVPDVSIQARNTATGVVLTTKSTKDGVYSLQSLFAGTYELTFTVVSMKAYKTSIQLTTAQNAVINPKMDVGTVTETVTVDAGTVQLTTQDSPTISATIDNTRLNELPVNGRFLLSFAALTVPGLEGGGQRANGLMPEALEYVQDGAPMTNRNFGGEGNSTQAQLPDPDAIQEVRIETSNSGAQFTTPATGIITSKSGTNAFHGSVFETARNNAIGIAKSRQNPANYAAPHYVRNEFGASIGGPVILPKIYDGHDKTFFFFAYERYSLRSFVSQLVKVPMVAWRSGDFSGLVNSSNNPITLYDPATTAPSTNCNNTGVANQYCRTPFHNNVIASTRQSPFSQKLMSITPLPSTSDNPVIKPNLNVPGINNVTIPQFNLRLDHVLNQNNRLFTRFTWISQNNFALRNFPSAAAPTIAGSGLPDGAQGLQNIPITTISAAVGYTHVFSSTFVSDTNVAQEWFNQQVQGGNYVNINYEKMFGTPNNFNEVGFPAINGLTMPYGGTQYNYGISQIITNVDENLSKIVGKHQLLFGGRYRHERFGYLPDRSSDSINFGGSATAQLDPGTGAAYNPYAYTGSADADGFLGAAASYGVVFNPPYQHYRDQEFDSYLQDNWRYSKNLTFNLGLRWEIHPAATAHDGITQAFDLKNRTIVMRHPAQYYVDKGYTTQAILTNITNLGMKFETPGAAGIPDALLYNYNWELSPRLGFAYVFNGKYGTILRAGFGRYIYPTPVRNSLKISAGNVPFAASYTQNYNNPAQTDGKANYQLRSVPSVIAGVNSGNVVDSTSVSSILPGVGLQTLDPHYGPAHVTEFNTTVEQPLPKNTVLRVTYLFNHGSQLDQDYSYNYHPSAYVYELRNGIVPNTANGSVATGIYDQTTYGQSLISQKTGFSSYNGVQFNLQRLFHRGYGFQIYEVYGKAFRVGGNYNRDGIFYPAEGFAPGILPATDFDSLNRYENYLVDTSIPRHHVGFNGLVDLPFGRGKRYFRNSSRWLDALIGGYQISGTGQVLSQWLQVANGNWGATAPIKTYGNSHTITDCRSGVCYKEKLWFNGYINPKTINASKNGVSGLPSDYTPYEAPVNNDPSATSGFAYTNFGSNNVQVKLANGAVTTTAMSPGPSGVNPYSHTFLQGPFNYNTDLSLFKIFSFTETVKLRINVDAFNAFNIQGTVNPSTTDGTISTLTSYWTPRQIQLTARLSF